MVAEGIQDQNCWEEEGVAFPALEQKGSLNFGFDGLLKPATRPPHVLPITYGGNSPQLGLLAGNGFHGLPYCIYLHSPIEYAQLLPNARFAGTSLNVATFFNQLLHGSSPTSGSMHARMDGATPSAPRGS